MFDIDMKNIKKGKSFFYIFLIVGLFFFFVIGGIFVFNIIKLNNLDSKVLSTRVEVRSYMNDEGSVMYSPVYHYEVNGQSYSCGSNASSNISPGTQNKNVYYDSKNPSDCMSEYTKGSNYIILLFLIIPIVFIIVAIVNIRKVNKKIKVILDLNQKGKLVKNLPYKLQDTGMSSNYVQIQRPVVDYTLPSGVTITLYGDARHDKKYCDADGMVDLLIDEDNLDNYYIDFEINRLTGNLPQDYYQLNYQNNSTNQYVQQQNSIQINAQQSNPNNNFLNM